jgi:hypothetical protein
MSASNGENRKRSQANQVAVEIIRVDGTHETATVDRRNWVKQVEHLIGADCLDSVDLRDGRVMFVDDLAYFKGLPDNSEATGVYHKICKPWNKPPNKGGRGHRRRRGFLLRRLPSGNDTKERPRQTSRRVNLGGAIVWP